MLLSAAVAWRMPPAIPATRAPPRPFRAIPARRPVPATRARPPTPAILARPTDPGHGPVARGLRSPSAFPEASQSGFEHREQAVEVRIVVVEVRRHAERVAAQADIDPFLGEALRKILRRPAGKPQSQIVARAQVGRCQPARRLAPRDAAPLQP